MRQHVLPTVLLGAVAAILYQHSFETWGHPLIDLGRDLVLPGQLLEGRSLYRDLLYNYGPVTPYLLASVVALFGDSLRVFESVGLLSAGVAAATLYCIGLRLGGIGAGFASALCFIALHAFANTTWGSNFVLPYAYAATFGITFALISFAFLERYLYAGRSTRNVLVSVLFLILAVWTKLEAGLAILVVHLVAYATHRVSLKVAASSVGALAIASAGVLLAFWPRSPEEHHILHESLFKFSGQALTDPFFLRVAGLERPWHSIAANLGFLVGMGLLIAASQQGPRLRAWRSQRPALAWLGGALLGLAGVALLWWLAQLRVMGAVVFAAPVLIALCLLRDRRDPLLLLAVFALGSAPRILLEYHPIWYGFTLSLPAYPLLVYGLGVRLPERLPAPRAALAVLCVWLACLLARSEYALWQIPAAKTSALVTPRGTLRDDPVGRTHSIRALLESFERPPHPQSLVVFPEGATLNYFTGVPNPTAYLLFTPPEIPDAETEARMLRELEAAAPDRIAIVTRDLREFGSRGFGVDYARSLIAWIQRDYVRETLATSGQGFRIALFRKR